MILLESQTSQPLSIMLPLSLYIHIPWCIRKCPYCDFNSHKSPDQLPEIAYVHALIADLEADLLRFPARPVQTIFIGGGTPSLLSAEAYALLFEQLKQRLTFVENIEITLEANPGTFEQQRFKDYRQLGINRLSLGIQSFNPKHLKALGRIHDDKQAHFAIESAQKAGFNNINLDIMHGLPEQSAEEGLKDLRLALDHQTPHLSWYQLTIEPNTRFYKSQPVLPTEEEAGLLEDQGLAMLASQGFERYEISAFNNNNQPAQHNLNYWLFGDYLGIGAGAHGKYSGQDGQFRTQKHRQPKDYLNPEKLFLSGCKTLSPEDLVFEFMLNATRLEIPIRHSLFEERTGLPFQYLQKGLNSAMKQGLITMDEQQWQVTAFGRRYTNNLQELFLNQK